VLNLLGRGQLSALCSKLDLLCVHATLKVALASALQMCTFSTALSAADCCWLVAYADIITLFLLFTFVTMRNSLRLAAKSQL
jgi:hypothetical protein